MSENSIISKKAHHTILSISETEIGKIVHNPYICTDMITGEIIEDGPLFSKRNIEKEIFFLKKANEINDLMVKFIRQETYKGQEMMVMERLYPLPYTSFDKAKRAEFLEKLEEQVNELHLNKFIHGDMVQPVGDIPAIFDNIVLTENGFRLIDTGFSCILDVEKMHTDKNHLRSYVHKKIQELEELNFFKEYVLALED